MHNYYILGVTDIVTHKGEMVQAGVFRPVPSSVRDLFRFTGMNAGSEHNVYMRLATTLCLTRVMQVRSELFGSGRDLQWGENSSGIFASNPGMGRNVYMP